MAHTIQVRVKDDHPDALGESVKKRIIRDLGLPVETVRIADGYTLIDDENPLSPDELEKLANDVFSDPVINVTSDFTPSEGEYLMRVGYRHGVTDNVGGTSRKAIRDRLGKECPVSTHKTYAIKGKGITREEVEKIASEVIANSLIEDWEIKDANEFYRDNGFGNRDRLVRSKHKPAVKAINLNVSDERLEEISVKGILSMDPKTEMKAIQKYFLDPKVIEERKAAGIQEPGMPTDAELEVLSQTWSEHCKHKIFNSKITYTDEYGKTTKIDSLFETYIKRATEEIRKGLGKNDWLVSVFSDNAGVIKFNDKYNLVMKVETHNTPSALDPYGGAITGIVGVNRDPLGTGLGARLIFNTDVFCFGAPDYDGELPSRLKHPKRVFEGVRRGVEHGGNKSGIPTVNGGIIFDPYPFLSAKAQLSNSEAYESYMGKPLVFCGTGGIIPAYINGRSSHIKYVNNGNIIVMTGGRIGKDGIHGATFSSLELDENSPVTAVQIGDPITQKKMADLLLEARDKGLYNAITDNGAGGLSSSVGEMAQMSGGCHINLEKCPLKYAGCDPWEIVISESQERMTLAVSPDKIDEFLKLARLRDVEATAIGVFDNSGKFKVTYADESGQEKVVAYLDMEFLHNGVPKKQMEATLKIRRHKEPKIEEPERLDDALLGMMSRLNICSRESVIRQYDHEVQAETSIKPLVDDNGPGDAAVLWPLEIQEDGSWLGVVVANGINPYYMGIDAYYGTLAAMDEATRNFVSAGGNPGKMAALDNFCWSYPEDPSHSADLVRANMALYDYSTGMLMPLISGKDSMKNMYKGIFKGKEINIGVPETILISAIGEIEDIRKAVTSGFKRPENRIYILGQTKNELGGSEYYAMEGAKVGEAFIGNGVPKVDIKAAKERYRELHQAMQNGYIAACHDCSNGGLLATLAEMGIGGNLGAYIDLGAAPIGRRVDRNDTIGFSESQSRFLVEVKKEYARKFEDIMSGYCAEIGAVTKDGFINMTGVDGKNIMSTPVSYLKQAWQKPLAW